MFVSKIVGTPLQTYHFLTYLTQLRLFTIGEEQAVGRTVGG
jgi:hypothetical protein